MRVLSAVQNFRAGAVLVPPSAGPPDGGTTKKRNYVLLPMLPLIWADAGGSLLELKRQVKERVEGDPRSVIVDEVKE
jgi:hypothetical protein